jgi:hypothetical protein
MSVTAPGLIKRLEALEADGAELALRVITVRQDWNWSPEERNAEMRRSLDALPPHRGLTVAIRRFCGPGAAKPALDLHSALKSSRRH